MPDPTNWKEALDCTALDAAGRYVSNFENMFVLVECGDLSVCIEPYHATADSKLNMDTLRDELRCVIATIIEQERGRG